MASVLDLEGSIGSNGQRVLWLYHHLKLMITFFSRGIIDITEFVYIIYSVLLGLQKYCITAMYYFKQ